MNPTVSIISSTFNDGKYLDEAINSVLNQSFTDWEFIIINDSSTDESQAIIQKYVENDKRFRLINNKKMNGLTNNLNKALILAKGKYIARIDGDDIWLNKKKLEKQVHEMSKNKKLVLEGTFGIKIDSSGKKLHRIIYPVNNAAIKKYSFIENCFISSSVLFRKSVISDFGGYENSYPSAEDYGLWIKLGINGDFLILPDFMTAYRVNPNGISQTKYSEQLESTINIVKKYKDYYPNFTLGIFLWHIRKYIPRFLREMITHEFRMILFFNKVRGSGTGSLIRTEGRK